MNRPTDPWTDRLSEYLDGSLGEGDLGRLGEHLRDCEACREVLEDLDRVRSQARTLADRPPRRDLWAGIREAIDEAKVIDLSERRGAPVGVAGRSGILLSLRQLAAAAAVVILVTGGTTWGVARATAPGVRPGTAAGLVTAPQDPVSRVAADDPALADFLAEVSRLEGVLTTGQDRLDANTVRILEKNLGIMDRAIRESVDALAVDPGNAFVEDYLSRSVERKVAYLREATALLDLTD